jgi:3'-phosphoadenosine 5'-phosphosulfate sulfotransferase (PAPS reductase)/FAD synthetase
MKVIGWVSAGITSAVACKIALEKYGSAHVRLIYIDTGSAHKDNERFLSELEQWYRCPIETIKTDKYVDHFDVCLKTRYINGPSGARCTTELKKLMRYKIERANSFDAQVFGFHYSKSEIARSERFIFNFPETRPIFPLIEARIGKQECLGIIKKAGIKPPEMYSLGYPNNNCIGCVKGGMGYWNAIRKDFPVEFRRMAEVEREVGHSCIKDTFLDMLLECKGRKLKIIVPECGVTCSSFE